MLQAPNEGQQGNPEAKKNAENEEEEYEENQENNGMSTIIELLLLPLTFILEHFLKVEHNG